MVNQCFVESDGFKDLCATVALQGGNTHLGKDLQQAFVDGFDVVIERFFKRNAPREPLAQRQIFQRFNSEVGVDGTGAITDEQRVMHHFARFAGFDDESHLGPQTLPYEVIVDGSHGEQTGNGNVVLVYATIGQNQNGVAIVNGTGSIAAQAVECAFESPFTFCQRKER